MKIKASLKWRSKLFWGEDQSLLHIQTIKISYLGAIPCIWQLSHDMQTFQLMMLWPHFAQAKKMRKFPSPQYMFDIYIYNYIWFVCLPHDVFHVAHRFQNDPRKKEKHRSVIVAEKSKPIYRSVIVGELFWNSTLWSPYVTKRTHLLIDDSI